MGSPARHVACTGRERTISSARPAEYRTIHSGADLPGESSEVKPALLRCPVLLPVVPYSIGKCHCSAVCARPPPEATHQLAISAPTMPKPLRRDRAGMLYAAAYGICQSLPHLACGAQVHRAFWFHYNVALCLQPHADLPPGFEGTGPTWPRADWCALADGNPARTKRTGPLAARSRAERLPSPTQRPLTRRPCRLAGSPRTRPVCYTTLAYQAFWHTRHSDMLAACCGVRHRLPAEEHAPWIHSPPLPRLPGARVPPCRRGSSAPHARRYLTYLWMCWRWMP